MGRLVCGRLAGHCPDGPEGCRESGLLAVLIGGGEDAAVEMLAAGKTDETERARTARRKALREWHLPLMTARVSGRCRRHKPGVRSALQVCNRSVSVGNGVNDLEVRAQSRVYLHAPDCEDNEAVRNGEENCAGLTARFSCCGVMGEAHSGGGLDNLG